MGFRMETTTRSDSIVRFGDFELNLRTRELYKGGSRLKLRGQPIDVLAILVQHPGDLVTRENLQKQLWPDDTFVDFEHILNNCVAKLRDTLGEQADSPKFIETLPRLGYRFIAPVFSPARNELESHQAPNAETAETAPETSAAALPRAAPQGNHARTWILLAATAIALTGSFAVARWYLHRNAYPPPIKSIAVLPFENLSGDPSQEYLADGMTEELITELGAFGSFRVISRTSVMQFKGKRKPLPEIARELEVEGIVEGTVARSGNHVRITANLLYAPRDHHLWANSYESEMEDVLVVQSRVAHSIANAIRAELIRPASVPTVAPRRVKPEAYQAYLEGRYHANKWTRDGWERAEASLRRSIDLDSTFAPAYSAISSVYTILAINGIRPATEVFPLAKSAASKAVELDDRLAEAHGALGFVMLIYDWDWAGAEQENKRAVLLNPSSVEAHAWYSMFLTAMGRHEEALREVREMVRLDPASPPSNMFLAWTLYWARQHDEAISQLGRVLELDPKFAWAYMELGWNYAQKEMYTEAITNCRKALALMTDDQVVLGTCGNVYGRSGRRQEALALLARLQRLARKDHVDPWYIAWLYDGAGDTDHCIEYLQRAYNERSASLYVSKVALFSQRIRSDLRFQILLKKLNYPS